MISPSDKQVTSYDLTLAATLVVVSGLVDSQLLHTGLFQRPWQHNALAVLMGFALHGLLTNKLSCWTMTQLELVHTGVRQSLYDLVKFGTVFVSQKVVTTALQNKPVGLHIFDKVWAMESGLTIAGFAVFNMIEPSVPRVQGRQPLVNDLIKISLGTLAAAYGVSGTVNRGHLIKLGGLLAGFTTFHLLTKKAVMPLESAGPVTCVSDVVSSKEEDSEKSVDVHPQVAAPSLVQPGPAPVQKAEGFSQVYRRR